MKEQILLVVVLCLSLSPAAAQDIQTKGSLRGTITDANGAVISNAKVSVTGPQTVDRVVTTNHEGRFEVDHLTPGVYQVKAEQTGFKAASVSNVEVFVGKATALKLTLEVGSVAEVVDVFLADAVAIDQASTSVGANLNNQLFEHLPLQRGVTSLFYLAPGVADSLRGGLANPSISGGSPLDNLYIADGVNITDPAFGGLGIFSRFYGTLGTGINTAFVKEVQVKTGGFEPQYGQAQGGIVSIITQSGGNEYHGKIYGFARPAAFEATRRQPDDTRVNKLGKFLHDEYYDAGVNVGGYVPGLRDHLFFFGSFNPSLRRSIVRGTARNASDIAAGTGRDSGLYTLLGDTLERYRTLNYAFKLGYHIKPSHQLNFSLFGDPTQTNLTPFRTLTIDNTTALSRLDLGTRNAALRYDGTLDPTWNVSVSFSQGRNHFDESGFANFNAITDRTQPARGNFRAIGLGSFEPIEGTTYRLAVDTSKRVSLLGTHTFGVGYQYQRVLYSGRLDSSGPTYTVPAANATGLPLTSIAASGVSSVVGKQMRIGFQLFAAAASCTLCPMLSVPGVGDRRVFLQGAGTVGDPAFDTSLTYHAGYVQDTWRINRYVTALLGLRTEQERLIGSPGAATGKRVAYSFTGQWAPRLGVTVDPLGRGRMKVFYNFGRFFEYIPLDIPERAFSNQAGFGPARYAPDFLVDSTGTRRARLNEFGTVIPAVDAAHLLNGATGGTGGNITFSFSDPNNPILPGTKLGFAQEHVVGFEQQLPHNFVLSLRYLDRRLKRIVEDGAVVSPESALFFGQAYFIGNISSRTDAGVNPVSFKFMPGGAVPTQCDPRFVNAAMGVCYATLGQNGKPAGSSGADGIPDGFPDPVHLYRAVEIELNKRFSNNWLFLSNWRIASLRGNFEGHFRNDNGQTDPAASSVFDFTVGEFGLLGDQNAVGALNTDRRHIVNLYGSYAFSEQGFKGFGKSLKGLNLGAGLHLESGVPISEYLAHPIYNSPGEIPVGGRGKLGRTPFFAQLDLHLNYPWQISERLKVNLIADFFNVTNNRPLRLPDQFRESTLGQLNPDFLQPLFFHLAFNMRLGMRFDW